MAALVQVEDRLLAPGDRLEQRVRQRRRDERGLAGTAQRRLAVDDLDRRQGAAVDALREAQRSQLAFLRAPQRFE